MKLTFRIYVLHLQLLILNMMVKIPKYFPENYVFHFQGKKPMRSVFNDVIYEEVEEEII